MKLMFSLIITVVFCGGLYIILKFLKAKQLKKENDMLGIYMESIEGFCDEIKKQIDSIRKYRHDLKGYIQTLEAMVEADCTDDTVRHHIKEQEKICSKLKSFEFCSDEFINTVISLKAEECKEKNIPINFEVCEGDYSAIDEIDKVCLIINLLDNAIESTQKLQMNEKPEIKLQMQANYGNVTIKIENSIEKNKRFSFITTKSDKQNHGLGTAIIKQVVDKYNGTRNTVVDSENGILRDEIILLFKKGRAIE